MSISSSVTMTAIPRAHDVAAELDDVHGRAHDVAAELDDVHGVVETDKTWSAFIEGNSPSHTVPTIRKQEAFAEKYAEEISEAMDGIEAFLQNTVDLDAKLLTVYPKTGKAIWRDLTGVTHTYNMLTKEEDGVLPALQALRNIYKESGDWKTELWPTYSSHTKGNDNGKTALSLDTPRLKERYQFSDKDKVNAIAKADTPVAKMQILKNLFVIEQFKLHMVKFFNSKSKKYSDNAITEKDITKRDQQNKIAENLKRKAEYFDGKPSNEEEANALNWAAVNTSLANPIHCLRRSDEEIVNSVTSLHGDVLDKIKEYQGDEPIYDTLGLLSEFIPGGDTLGRIGSALLGLDRTDHAVVSKEKGFAIDQAILGIEHEDLKTQRYLTELSYKKLGIDCWDIPKDPVEFILGVKLAAVIDRSPIADIEENMVANILGNETADIAFCSGLLPEIVNEIRKTVIDFAKDTKAAESRGAFNLKDSTNPLSPGMTIPEGITPLHLFTLNERELSDFKMKKAETFIEAFEKHLASFAS